MINYKIIEKLYIRYQTLHDKNSTEKALYIHQIIINIKYMFALLLMKNGCEMMAKGNFLKTVEILKKRI